jgi:hypothetical protein
MIAIGCTLEQVHQAVGAVNAIYGTYILVQNPRESGVRIKRAAFTLHLRHSKLPFHRRAYTCRCNTRDTSHKCNGYVMPYVCYHGNRAVMMALFEINPHLRLQTKFIKYKGILGFEREHRDVYYMATRTGGLEYYFGQLCDCEPPGAFAGENWPPAPAGYHLALETVERGSPLPAHEALSGLPTFQDTGNDNLDLSGADDAIARDLVRPEEIGDDRWAEVNRKFNELFYGEGT